MASELACFDQKPSLQLIQVALDAVDRDWIALACLKLLEWGRRAGSAQGNDFELVLHAASLLELLPVGLQGFLSILQDNMLELS